MKDRPHILGVDDAAFEKSQPAPVPIIGVMTEGADLVENVAVTAFPVDGAAATDFLASWIEGLRFRPSLQSIVLGGITIAGLGVVDIRALSDRLALPVLVFNRKDPERSVVCSALRSAGHTDRIAIVERTPAAIELGPGRFLAWAGVDERTARHLLAVSANKSSYPEAIRIAHLIGKALVDGESRGRV